MISAQYVPPSLKVYRVVLAHAHKGLNDHDRVVVRKVPAHAPFMGDNVLLRLSDLSLHELQDCDGEYLILRDDGVSWGEGISCKRA